MYDTLIDNIALVVGKVALVLYACGSAVVAFLYVCETTGFERAAGGLVGVLGCILSIFLIFLVCKEG